MKDRRLTALGLGTATLVLAMMVLLSMTQVTFAKKGGKGKIAWSENPVTAIVLPGETFSATVSFSSTIALDNVNLDATKSLSATTTLSPKTFATVSAGVPYSVEVTFSVPSSGDREQFNGVVHLRTRHKNHPHNLKLRFSVPFSLTNGTTTP